MRLGNLAMISNLPPNTATTDAKGFFSVTLPAAAIERGIEMANANSWDSIVQKLEDHIADAMRTKARVPA